MTEDARCSLPADLLIVGLVLAFYGAASVVGMLASMWVGPFRFSFGFICLPLGHGLVRLSRWHRDFTIAVLDINCLLLVAALLLPLTVAWAEAPFPGSRSVARMVLVLAFCAWGLNVIARRSWQGAFADAPPKGRPMAGRVLRIYRFVVWAAVVWGGLVFALEAAARSI